MRSGILRLVIGLAFIGGFVSGAADAHAQACDDASKDTLQQCIYGAVADCGAETSACNTLEGALTLQDVEDIAVAKCCSKPKSKKRKSCLKKEERSYVGSHARGDRRTFFAAAKKVVKDLRDSDCNNNAYNSLF